MFDPTAFFTQYQALKGVKPETWDKLSQTWPARMAQSAWNAATLPGDVWNGKVDPLSEEGIGRATDLAGLTMSSTLASPRGSIGVGPVLPKKPNPMAVEPPTPMTMTPPQGIRAYHGSPHDFDKFDISKIGTGEGAQVYGHGLYFAENEKVAKQYRDNLTRKSLSDYFDNGGIRNTPKWVADQINAGNSDKMIRHGLSVLEPNATEQQIQGWIKEGRSIFDAVDKTGRMYEVNINARPDQFLDWDKPMHQQSELVQNIMGEVRNQGKNTGGNRYLEWAKDFSDPHGNKTSAILNQAGIPGIRYLDQGSRGQGNGTFNYVVFNDALIDILKKYGIAGMAAAPVIAGAVNQQEPVANY